MPYTESELGHIVSEVRAPYILRRDPEWDARRAVRHRRSVPWLPEGLDQFDKMIRYRDSTPGFYIEGMKQRLGVNAINLEVRATGDPGPKDDKRIATLENWFYGMLAALDPVGQIDLDFRDGQVADGIAFGELEFLPRFTPDSKDKRTIDEQRKYAPIPYRLNAPDPKGLAWLPYDVSRGLKVMVKTMDVPLVEIQDNWRAEDIRLSYSGDPMNPNKLSASTFIYGSEQAPAPSPGDMGKLVRFVMIADEHHIYHCVYPHTVPSGGSFLDSAHQAPQLILLKAYPNPINEVPFYACWGRKTRAADPALMYQPIALEQLDQAEYTNQMTTIRMMRAVLESMKPWPLLNNSGNELTEMPEKLRPGFMEIPQGVSIGTFPDNSVPDLDRIIGDLKDNAQRFELSLFNNEQVGKSTPAWGANIFNEEIMGFLKGPVDSRANCWRDILNAVAKCTYAKHAKDGPLYVRTTARSEKRPERGEIDTYVGISAEDLEPGSYRLEVSIEAMTQSARAAHTEYGRRLKDEGAISVETYETDYAMIEDREAEQRRKDREMIQRSLVSPQIAAVEHVRETMRPMLGQLVDVIFGPSPLAQQQSPEMMPPGQALPGDAEPQGYPSSPGMDMPLELQEPPSVRSPNGAQPAVI